MTARAINPNDIDRLREIHSQYFKDEFSFPDFLNGFNCSYLVEDNNGDVICAGGIRPIAEVILITDKNQTNRNKITGLKEFLNISRYIGSQFNYDSLHAFVQDENWLNILNRSGFSSTKGKSLILGL